MSEHQHGQGAGTPSQAAEDHEPQSPLRTAHLARAHSAASRAAAVLRHIEGSRAEEERAGAGAGAEEERAGAGTRAEEERAGAGTRAEILFKAGHAARVAAQALAVLHEGRPQPAADSRCARNAAAAASQAARMGELHDEGGELAATASRAALKAAQAAGAASAAGAGGENQTLNAEADAAEKAAVAAAEAAGWTRPEERVVPVATGIRSADVMAMTHF
ncbi:hypothetical protein ABR738_20535 [Streptomyces sp. Edi4]|uniref:hypothetical protein n=1 Tax=Streptomyces sp. Edi4 TaxID=3162527 RepID=UPI003305FF2E